MRRWVVTLISGVLAVGAQAPQPGWTSSQGAMAGMDVMVFVDSGFPYAETLKRLKTVIRTQGTKVMFVDDQQATLRKVGVKSPGAVVIEFFNAEYTKRIFETDHAAHMATPLRIGFTEGGEAIPTAWRRT